MFGDLLSVIGVLCSRCYPGVTHDEKAPAAFYRKGLIFLVGHQGLEPRTN